MKETSVRAVRDNRGELTQAKKGLKKLPLVQSEFNLKLMWHNVTICHSFLYVIF